MSVLSDEKNHEAICWLPHGRAFIIRNRLLFAEKVMPRFFPRKSKYSSFTRKLNRWNFIRVSSGPEHGAYYHEFFLRDQPHLAAQMFCKNARSKIAMATPEPEPVKSASPPTVPKLDPSHVLMANGVDSAMALILKQQLSVCNVQQQQLQMQQLQQHKQRIGINDNALSLLLGNTNGGHMPSQPTPGSWLHNEILAQKQQQQRMLQLKQLMAVNLNQQNRKQSSKNNFRASAA
jgi:hypothetical protein